MKCTRIYQRYKNFCGDESVPFSQKPCRGFDLPLNDENVDELQSYIIELEKKTESMRHCARLRQEAIAECPRFFDDESHRKAASLYSDIYTGCEEKYQNYKSKFDQLIEERAQHQKFVLPPEFRETKKEEIKVAASPLMSPMMTPRKKKVISPKIKIDTLISEQEQKLRDTILILKTIKGWNPDLTTITMAILFYIHNNDLYTLHEEMKVVEFKKFLTSFKEVKYPLNRYQNLFPNSHPEEYLFRFDVLKVTPGESPLTILDRQIEMIRNSI